MGSSGSIPVIIAIVVGTAALIGFVRLIGLYADSTHPVPEVRPKAVPTGPDPRLLIAILSAAAVIELGDDKIRLREIHELSANANSPEWGVQGRKMIFQSHRLRS